MQIRTCERCASLLRTLVDRYDVEKIKTIGDAYMVVGKGDAAPVADLALDSLGLVEMLFEIEDKYGFQIPDPMVFLPMTFAEMVASISTMVQEHTAAQVQAATAH